MCDYLDNYKKIVTVEDILNGKIKMVKDFKINDHNALIERFKQADLFSEDLSDTHLENIAKYFLELPSELAMHFFHNVISKGTSQESVTRNIASLYSLKIGNTSMKEYVISILMAKK